MKIFLKRIILFFLLFLGIGNVKAQSNHSIKQFEFMLGDWLMKTSTGSVVESWKKTKNSMVGESYRIGKENAPVLTERIVLSLIDNVYNFSVTGLEEGNKGTTNFVLVSSKDDTFIFENKNHDFPQLIIYQYKDKNNLLAWIEGSINGKMKKIDFPYQRKN